MTDPDIPKALAAHPFFQGLPPAFLSALGTTTTLREYGTGDRILRAGAPATEFIAVVEGKIALESAGPARLDLIVQTLGPGEVLGWSWLLPDPKWSLDARAVKPSRVLVLDAASLRMAMQTSPAEGLQFLLRLLPVIAHRLEMMRIQLLDLHAE